MASDTRMGETPPLWRRARDIAQDGMESSGMLFPSRSAAELGLTGYPEPGKLSYGTEKGCPWRGPEGCLGPCGRLGCPCPPAPPCLRDALCQPEDGAELPTLLPPSNGQPCKEHPGPRWAEAVLGPLALYSHRYPLPLPGMGTPRPGKPRAAAGDRDGVAPALHHCPFVTESKHSPFLLSSLLPPAAPAEPPLGGGTEGCRAMSDEGFAGLEWCLRSYPPAWGQPLYLGVPPRDKEAPAPFGGCSSSGNKELCLKKEPSFHPPAKDQAPLHLLGKGQAGQEGDRDGDRDGDTVVPGALWRGGLAPHARTPPPSTSHPLFLLHPSVVGNRGGPWVGTRAHATHFPMDPGPGRPSEPKDLVYQSLQPGAGEFNPSPPLTDGHHPPVHTKPEHPPACLCSTPGCDGCPRMGCGVLDPFEPPLAMPPPSNHTKLKKTWLTRHSEQSLPHSKSPHGDGASETPAEGKRSAKRPHGTTDGAHGAGDGSGAAKRGTKATEPVAAACRGDGTESGGDPEERRMELGEGGPREPWWLQSEPCTALPRSIPRCCTCTGRALRGPGREQEEEEEEPESSCRLLRFRRFALGADGELSPDGFCTLEEAEGELLEAASPERGIGSTGSSLCLAKYLLRVLGDPFCEAVRRDRDVWAGAPEGKRAPGSGVTPGAGGLRAVFPIGVRAWRRGAGAPQLCDSCQRGFFNSHWSCPRCGFQLCPECHRNGRGADGHEGPAWPPECIPGQAHPIAPLIPTQFIPTRVLTRLWKLLHRVRAQFGIDSHCPCGEGAAEQSPAEPPPGSRQELPGATVPTPPHSGGHTDTSRPTKEETTEEGTRSPGQRPPRGAVHPGTLCDLLASTAVKLCLGQDGVRMAFAPVSPALPSDNHLTSILDSIIARVVERKIQQQQAGGEMSPPSASEPPSPPSPPVSHCILAPSGLLWLQDPGHAAKYELFQEHWRQGEPVLVSGLQKWLEERLWGPESFSSCGMEQMLEVVNLRAPATRLLVSSQEFWGGFTASAASPELDQGSGDLLKLESGFGDMEPCRATNLSASLPLPEYCGSSGHLNLGTYLQGHWAQRCLRPRVCAAYGVMPQDRTIGTKTLTVEVTDSISILVHAAAGQPAAQQAMLLQAEDVDAALKERLQDAGSRPGALWHIFRAEDASRIQGFLQKAREDQGQERAAMEEQPGPYLDLSLRTRLRQECGVSCWTLLQCLGDAVLVPAGAPHQVQTLTSTISVEQRFLSPEHIVQLRDHSMDPTRTTRQLCAQLDSMIFSAVREAVGVLQGCK
ncbi:lysine-specific demethylase hairless isoform X1 [Pezoporus wallicus]|uniref:lysine-specific demethylase hairless isoform X1 n=1 Tax=Pezoporus wallicus TaxID=35540 RepID=UPI00255131C7|nr:lysine-specific demethylase hairless isoform X1 [Pezoporus wallicus]XP_057268619.1 lysine-specific demethylase hairless isoform X1 [Pezoporus wallicus]XP_057268620.1 lysine-specific demethylase hairless isoform X1 [Pezoporus wallicus]XP_057268621.1 lysine-specific demethylase hairless isoform X1 [Pezoporus wallicus]XP_061328579.1 lysine-specific demethylase hairless isoform X1 [Pezoporus flaviventris]XP_061328580.1 lysine-specific demethylase hairless isoform X1 [Pezoporus flaviventris]XP_